MRVLEKTTKEAAAAAPKPPWCRKMCSSIANPQIYHTNTASENSTGVMWDTESRSEREGESKFKCGLSLCLTGYESREIYGEKRIKL